MKITKIPSRGNLNEFLAYTHVVMSAYHRGQKVLCCAIGGDNWVEAAFPAFPAWWWNSFDYAIAPHFVPLERGDIVDGMLFAKQTDTKTLYVPKYLDNGKAVPVLYLGSTPMSFETLMKDYFYTTNSGKTFHSCSKEA